MTPVQVIVDGVRTRYPSGAVEPVRVRGVIRPAHPHSRDLGADDLCLFLLDGPTGWESAPIIRMLDDLADDPNTPGWIACFGRNPSYDQLVVTRDSMLALAATVAATVRIRDKAGVPA